MSDDTAPANEFTDAVARQIGRVAQQGAAKALNRSSAQKIIQEAVRGAQSEIGQRAASFQAAQPTVTTTSAPAEIRFEGGVEVPEAFAQRKADRRTQSSFAARVPSQPQFFERPPTPEDANVTLFESGGASGSQTFETIVPPGGVDSAEDIERALEQQDNTNLFREAQEQGPKALRTRSVVPTNVVIPVRSEIKTKSDGIVPEKTQEAKRITPRRIIGVSQGGGWPAGEIIEDRNQYGPKGIEARVEIDKSAVDVVATEENNRVASWYAFVAVAVAILVILVYAVVGALNDKNDIVEQAELEEAGKDKRPRNKLQA